jgi:hypothetical protein
LRYVIVYKRASNMKAVSQNLFHYCTIEALQVFVIMRKYFQNENLKDTETLLVGLWIVHTPLGTSK